MPARRLHPAGRDLAAGGDTINVASGTYVEPGQIVIGKDLTIAGAGAPTTVVKPAGDTGSSGDARGWFLVDSGATFDLSGMTLDGTGRKVWQAIRDWGKGTISNCAFQNIKFEESGPSYAGTAVAVFGEPDMNVDITGCTFSGIGRVGVLYFGSGVTDSTFGDNTYTGKGDGNWLDYAVEVGAGARVTITDNTISGNTGVASVDGSTSAGILVTTYYGDGTQATISGNDISGCANGIGVGYDASDTSVVTAHLNNLAGNAAGVDSTAPLVDATNNWWGSANGPENASNTFNVGAQGVAVGDNVDFVPWLDAPAPGGASFAPVTTTDPIGSYASIQAGVNASNPDGEVDAKAGTYNEQVIINKPLTVNGAGQGVTVIAPSPIAVNTTRVGGGSPGSGVAGIVVIDSTTDVTIRDLTVDGAGNALTACDPPAFMGVYWRNASGTIEDSEVRNIEWGSGLEGCQGAIGIFAEGGGGGGGGGAAVTINGNSVHDVQKNGITALGSGMTATISGNTVVGWGPTDKIAQNGIQLGFGAGGSITDNDASGLRLHAQQLGRRRASW